MKRMDHTSTIPGAKHGTPGAGLLIRHEEKGAGAPSLRSKGGGRTVRAFSLVEMLIVIMVLAILAAVVVPLSGSTEATRLMAAARLLVVDIEFAQHLSITHPDDPALLKIDQANNRYWVAQASDVDTPVTDPGSLKPLLGQFGAGRGTPYTGVTIQSYSLDGDEELHFSGVGLPDQTSDATVVLASGVHTMTITVAATSGEVSVQ
jgi:prepilin-type N-terminal cleavage/methylation domain-containing protein